MNISEKSKNRAGKKKIQKRLQNLQEMYGGELDVTKIPPLAKPLTGNDKRIDEIFGEVLFKMWMAGKNFTEIVETFKGTPRSFSYIVLMRARAAYKWDDRRAAIVKHLHDEVDDEVKISRRRQLQMVNMMLEMNLKIIEMEYTDFMMDPQKFIDECRSAKKPIPAWFARDPKDLFDLLKSHAFATEDKSKINDDKFQDASLALTPDEATTIWSMLRNAATRSVLPQPSMTVALTT